MAASAFRDPSQTFPYIFGCIHANSLRIYFPVSSRFLIYKYDLGNIFSVGQLPPLQQSQTHSQFPSFYFSPFLMLIYFNFIMFCNFLIYLGSEAATGSVL